MRTQTIDQETVNMSTNLNEFLEHKKEETMRLAMQMTQKTTMEIVDTEMALMDFELLLSVNLPKNETEKLTKLSRKLRIDSWNELSKKFNNNHDDIMEFLEKF